MLRNTGFVLAIGVLALAIACAGEKPDEVSGPVATQPETVAVPEKRPAETTPAKPAERPTERVEIESYKDVEALFEKLGYTPEAWQAGVREVPRMYTTNIPERWGSKYSKEVTVQTKKRLFFRVLAPLVLRSNELILGDRTRAESLASSIRTGDEPSADDRQWLQELAAHYKVIDSTDEPLDSESLDELLVRVDIVPVSLTLSQGAEESGWGTSRFVAEGNALFGQWTWDEKAMKPAQQRRALGNYGIAAFETPLQSVMAHAQNLNTHRAYAGLRSKRAEMRRNGHEPSGRVLAATLTSYSERGEAYVKTLHVIMDANHLDATDEAHLGDGPDILLIPVGEGV
jgi:uncharacterized FlgJ-related protein